MLLAIGTCLGHAQQGVPPGEMRQSLDDAWWTGPMLAASAATLPRGHFLVEPYFYDVSVQGQYDGNGNRHSARHSNGFGSLTYIMYGLADRVSVGVIPVAGFTTPSGGLNSSGVGWGDLTLLGQYQLAQFHSGNRMPTISLVLQETLPTGKYDHLGKRIGDGLGSGAYTTMVAFYAQTYFWMPSGRILRGRIDVSQSFSKKVKVEDVSVYGTGEAFRGYAKPGSSFFLDLAGEYSLTRRWVLALDATYRHSGNTSVSGSYILHHPIVEAPLGARLDSGTSDAFGLAPAIEYNFSSSLGVVLGTNLIPAERNTAATITPMMAINFVH